MAGLGGLGTSTTEHIPGTLFATRQQQASAEIARQTAEAELRAKELMSKDPRTAAILALPKIEVPQAQPVSRNLLIGGAVAAAALVGLIIWRSR